MKCPECEHEHSQVVETITLDCIVWRRRACLECDYRWWTSEIEDEPLLPIWPKKARGYRYIYGRRVAQTERVRNVCSQTVLWEGNAGQRKRQETQRKTYSIPQGVRRASL